MGCSSPGLHYDYQRKIASAESCSGLIQSINNPISTPVQKAREINNLEGEVKGVFAEIGAGQEVVGNFYRAQRASETVVKSISAYGKEESNRLYGEGQRFVSEVRLNSMLDKEFESISGLKGEFKPNTTIFAMANTVTTNKNGSGHGWIGIRYLTPGSTTPIDIKVHMNFGKTPVLKQHADLGTFGVNLIHSAILRNELSPTDFARSLMDHLDPKRINIDALIHSGKANFFTSNVRNFLDGELGSNFLFNKNGPIVPKDLFYKKNIVVSSGQYPTTTSELDKVMVNTSDNIPLRELDHDEVSWGFNKQPLIEKLKFLDQGMASEIDYHMTVEELNGMTASQYQNFVRSVKALRNSYHFHFTGVLEDLSPEARKLLRRMKAQSFIN